MLEWKSFRERSCATLGPNSTNCTLKEQHPPHRAFVAGDWQRSSDRAGVLEAVPSLTGFTKQALKKESIILVYGLFLCLHSPG